MHEYNYSCLLTIYKNVYMTNREPVVLQSCTDGLLVCTYLSVYVMNMHKRSKLTSSEL